MHRSRSRVLPIAALLAIAQGGCLCPPCAEAPGAGGGVKQAKSGETEMIWDGDTAGGKAQGWADCDAKPDCKSTAVVSDKEGVDGGKAVHFHGDGPKWLGMGWNWFGWWPENAGVDLRPYDTLTFSIRVVVKDPKDAPDPAGMTVGMVCSNGKKNSASVSLEKYLKNPGDGKWHDVAIPLVEFYKGKEGHQFDPASAWELSLGTWSSNKRVFDIYLDNIAVMKK